MNLIRSSETVAAVARSERTTSNRFLAALPSDDYRLLAPHLRSVLLARGSVLHDSDEAIEHIYFPDGAMVSILVTMRDGTTVETVALGRAAVICANATVGSRQAVGKAVVQIPGTARRIGLARFEAAAHESPTIREVAACYNDMMLRQVQQTVACNALHGLEQRLCTRLLQAQDCCDDDNVPLTQESLGQMLGVRRTSVTIEARLLQQQGMISYRRGQIRITDRAALEEHACECYASMRDDVDKVLARPD